MKYIYKVEDRREIQFRVGSEVVVGLSAPLRIYPTLQTLTFLRGWMDGWMGGWID